MTEVSPDVGYFVISFDLEFAWGHHDCFNPRLFSQDGQRERAAVSRLLELLDEYDIVATWAVVGHLCLSAYDPEAVYPAVDWLEHYPQFDALNRNSHPLLYEASIIDLLQQKATRHEIGFHGYTHQVFAEHRMTASQAATEIEAWQRTVMHQCDEDMPLTVIFPRNQIGHLSVFQRYGFIGYRGAEQLPTPFTWPVVGRVFRRLYPYLSVVTVPQVVVPEQHPLGIVNIPASRWLFGTNRTLDRTLDLLNLHTLRMYPLVQAARKAAAQRKVLHVWAHPYEFQTQKDFDKLRYLLEHVASEIRAGRLESMGMGALARCFSHSLHA
jgi:peptidoglycan/xylan/chitin deacetylase (PgdA/CDA1 family)